MKFLIVNADDFGFTPGVNRAVIEGHTRGIITSTTLMANMAAADEAVQLAKEHPSLGVGLHFNITQGRPIAPVSQLASLTNARGEFSGRMLAQRALTGHLRIEEVVIELRAQIEKVLSAGLHLTHLDSHKHSHALPQVCTAIIDTIKDYGIHAVRLPRENWRFDHLNGSLKLMAQGLGALGLTQLCRYSEDRLKRADIKTTNAFFGIAQTGRWTGEWLRGLIEGLPNGVSELMCHPGYEDEQLKAVKTRLRKSRVVELKLLTDPEIITLLQESRVQLVNYSYIK